MVKRVAILIAVIAAVLNSGLLRAEEWTGWLGPRRTGWVANFQPPETWPKQLAKSWEVEVGDGYGSPLVAGGRVFQHARQGENEVLWCLELATGKTVWKRSQLVPFTIGGGGEYHGKGPKSSPILAAGRVFTMSITGVVSAWDARSGKLQWKRDYAGEFKEAKRPYPYWGHSTSPVVANQHLFVHVGPDDRGFLVALDVNTGEEAWRYGKDGPSYSSPLVAEIGGVKQVVEWNHRALVGVESSSGKFLWEYPFPHVGSDQNMPTPTIHDGKILLGGENRGILGLKPVEIDGTWTVNELWHQKSVALNMSSAVMNGGKLYGFSHYGKGRFFCLDPESGEVLWQGPGRVGNNVMFLSIPGHLVALVNTGDLKIFKADDASYQEVVSYRVGESQSWAPPVLLSTGILVKDETTLRHWTFPTTVE